MPSGQGQPGYVVLSGSKISPGGPTGVPGTQGGIGLNAFNTTASAFTVPPAGQTTTVTLNDASWVVPGQLIYVDQAAGAGPGSAGELQVTAKAGNVITVLTPFPPGLPGLASAAGPGLAPTLPAGSGSQTTTWLRGDNSWQPLPQTIPTGIVMDYAGTVAPGGFLICDGSAVSRTTYAALYAAFGGASSPWGQGDGSTTFNVPDLRSRVTVGSGQGSGLTNRTLGVTGGEETHTLVLAELASHTHGVAHTHGMGNHTHGVAHTHTMGNHTHLGVDHLHSMQNHTHGYDHYHSLSAHYHYSSGVDHLHSLQGHTHGYTSCALGAGGYQLQAQSGGAQVNNPAANTGGPSAGTTAASDRSLAFNTGGPSADNTNWASQESAGWGTSGGPSSGTTGAMDRGATTGGPSTNTTDGASIAATAGPSTNTSDGASIASTAGAGSDGAHNTMPPFAVLNKIVKT